MLKTCHFQHKFLPPYIFQTCLDGPGLVMFLCLLPVATPARETIVTLLCCSTVTVSLMCVLSEISVNISEGVVCVKT
jgi:hypothetical protein